VRNRTTQSALLVAGAAVGAAAATAWVGTRRDPARRKSSSDQRSSRIPLPARATAAASSTPRAPGSNSYIAELVSEDLIEADGPELPIGRSADPDIDYALQPSRPRQEETSGSALLAHSQGTRSLSESLSLDESGSLDEIWDATPSLSSGDQGEGYDAVSPEDLGSVWLQRATQTTHEARPDSSDPADLPELEGFLVGEATLAAALPADDDDGEEKDESREDEDESREDEDGEGRRRS
jgi:hypothetical protein